MKSFESIYEENFKKVFLFLYRLSGDKTLAEELTQQTLYNAFLNIKEFQGRSSIFTWLCTIAKNNWLKECNRQKRFSKRNELIEVMSEYNIEQNIIEKQTINKLRKELKSLPEPYMTVCTLKIYAELSYKEIALELKRSEGWARVTFFRGKEMLVERMGECR